MPSKDPDMKRELAKALLSLFSIITGTLLLYIFTSCSPRIYPPTEIVHSTDTVIRERLVHDTATFYVEKEVEKIVTRDTLSHLENTYAKSDASVQDGYLHHSLETKPHTVYVPVDVVVHDTVVVEKKAETFIKEVEKKLTWWQRVRMDLFWVFGGLVLLFIGLRFIK